MIKHVDLGITVYKRSKQLKLLLDDGLVTLAGNLHLKIYGMLHCSSGRRMKPENRIFFKNKAEAVSNGFRPCGHCMNAAYQKWKALNQATGALSKS